MPLDDHDAAAPLRIGELAAALGLNPKTLRYYEAIGLLPLPQRTKGGYRLYGPVDRERLRFIGRAKTLGLSLAEIGEILTLRDGGACPCGHVLALLDRKLAAVEEQLRALTDLRGDLRTLRDAATRTTPDRARLCAIIEHHPPSP